MLTFTGPTTVHVYVALDPELLRPIIRSELAAALIPLEEPMTNVAEIIAAQDVKVSTLAAAFGDFASDVRAYISEHPPTEGPVSDEDAAAADALMNKTDNVIAALSTLDVEVGDADGSDVPPVEPTA